MTSLHSDSAAPTRLEARKSWRLLFVLATIQFIHVLDFVIVMPLGPQLMRLFGIGPQSFGFLVSAYNLAAALAGLAGAFFLDRVDRKLALLAVFGGFIFGTIGCAFSQGFLPLLLARLVTGAFGGLIQALLFAIIGDTFEEEKRGAATGTVMSAFSLASIAGVPVALSLADKFDWRAPFLLLSLLSLAAWIGAYRILPRLHSHRIKQTSIEGIVALLRHQNTLAAFLLTITLMFAGFTVIPFMSAYLVSNVGLEESDLAIVFLAGGAATVFTSRLAGTFADRYGKSRVFTWLAATSTLPVFVLTHLPQVPVAWAVTVTTLFTVLISARAVPALAMITSSVERSRRGGFLSLTSSVQQAASGLASLIAGAILLTDPDGEIMRYGLVGNIAIVSTILAILAARNLQSR